MVEQSAVNRSVVGSSPTFGAIFVYILENPQGKFYIGQSENLEQRLANHNRTDSYQGKFTRKNGPWKLVWFEAHQNRSSAVIRERQIKAMKSSAWIRTRLLKRPQSAVNPEVSGL